MTWFLVTAGATWFANATHGPLAAAGAFILSAIAYRASLSLWPYTRCGRCGGTGARRSPSGEYYGRCRRCKGSPEKLRLGNRLFRAGKA